MIIELEDGNEQQGVFLNVPHTMSCPQGVLARTGYWPMLLAGAHRSVNHAIPTIRINATYIKQLCDMPIQELRALLLRRVRCRTNQSIPDEFLVDAIYKKGLKQQVGNMLDTTLLAIKNGEMPRSEALAHYALIVPKKESNVKEQYKLFFPCAKDVKRRVRKENEALERSWGVEEDVDGTLDSEGDSESDGD